MVGVIIGRFQVDEIHDGHVQLLNWVKATHPQVLILLGCRHSPATRSHPLDFTLRQQMVKEVVPDAVILPVFDMADDYAWSRQVDSLIAGVFPNRHATLYGGRDSFVPHYHGQHSAKELTFAGGGDSGTNIRRAIAERPKHGPAFRAGVIYAMEHLTPRIFLAVDIAVLKGEQVLLGQKPGETAWRFPGGFVDLADPDLEHAARRELHEETGLSVEGPMSYPGSYTVNDWRTRGVSDAKTLTALFKAEYSFGPITPGDDLSQGLQWFDLGYDIKVNPTHAPLLARVRELAGVAR